MATAGPMAIPTDTDILTLTQWLSPTYPVGALRLFAWAGMAAIEAVTQWPIASGHWYAWIADVIETRIGPK